MRSPSGTPLQTTPTHSAIVSSIRGLGSRSPSLSLMLGEMRREQTKNKRRIIIGSALTLASVCFILLALLVWLLSPSPHLKPTTIAAKASKRAAAVTSGSPADHRNYSRFGVIEQDEEASADGGEHWDLKVWLRRRPYRLL